jgi:hypothetical protein
LDEKDIVKSGHVFKVKKNSEGEIERYKTRVVAHGYVQVEGINFQDIFASVAKLTSFRILLAPVTLLDLELDHMDVVTAFLNGVLTENVYMYPPSNGEELVWKSIPDGFVLKLLKAWYGLKQAGRTWYDTIHNIFVTKYRLEADHSLYLQRNGEDFIILLLYVDDLALESNWEKRWTVCSKSC